MLRVCTLQHVDDFDDAEDLIDFSSLMSINYKEVKWKNVAALVALHAGGMAGWLIFLLGYMQWLTVLWNLLLGLVSIIGITVGALSLWSHRIYDAKKPLKLFLVIAQTMASQDSIWVWVRDHRQHCQHKNTDADPFNPKRGNFFSHVGWLMMKRHPEVIEKGKKADMSDLEADSLVMFQKRYYLAMYLLLTVLQLVVPCYLWAELGEISALAFLARMVVILHLNWCIHSLHNFDGMEENKEEKTDGDKKTKKICVGNSNCRFDPTSVVLNTFEKIGLIVRAKNSD